MSTIKRLSAIQGCSLRGVPLYICTLYLYYELPWSRIYNINYIMNSCIYISNKCTHTVWSPSSSMTVKSVANELESFCFLLSRSTVLVSSLTCLGNLHLSLHSLFSLGRPNGVVFASSRRFLDTDCSLLPVLCNGNVLLLPAHILAVSLREIKPLGLVSASMVSPQ